MSTPQPVTVPNSLKPLQSFVIGKITATRRHKDKHFTQILSPAKDEYSKPSGFEIISSTQIGQKDDFFKGLCELSGYITTEKYQDKETGEMKEWQKKFQYLTLVE